MFNWPAELQSHCPNTQGVSELSRPTRQDAEHTEASVHVCVRDAQISKRFIRKRLFTLCVTRAPSATKEAKRGGRSQQVFPVTSVHQKLHWIGCGNIVSTQGADRRRGFGWKFSCCSEVLRVLFFFFDKMSLSAETKCGNNWLLNQAAGVVETLHGRDCCLTLPAKFDVTTEIQTSD